MGSVEEVSQDSGLKKWQDVCQQTEPKGIPSTINKVESS